MVIPSSHLVTDLELQPDTRTKIREATMYNPSVANNDRTMFRNMAFVKKSVNCRGRLCTLAAFLIPLKASKNAAVYITR